MNLLKKRKWRAILVVIIVAFFAGFLYDSKKHADQYYSALYKSNAAINELANPNCAHVLDQKIIGQLRKESHDIEFITKLEQDFKDCANLIDAIITYPSLESPITRHQLEDHFSTSYNNFTLKNNFLNGIIFLLAALIVILLFLFLRTVFYWVLQGEK